MLCTLWTSTNAAQESPQANSSVNWTWDRLPPLPDPLGVAGAFVGTHHGALLVAGGANFAEPVWDHPKQWSDAIHVLVPQEDGAYSWVNGGSLHRSLGYGA